MYKLKTTTRTLLADTVTPVNIYLKLRDIYAGSILLESSDYHGHENSLSFICCEPIAAFQVGNEIITCTYPDGTTSRVPVTKPGQVLEAFEEFIAGFESDGSVGQIGPGFFGYTSYDAVRYFEDVRLKKNSDHAIPELNYQLFRFRIVIDHFTNVMTLVEHSLDSGGDDLAKLELLILSNRFARYSFRTTGAESANMTDDDFLKMVAIGKDHCFKGDVFQIVLSRRFSTAFQGDEFNVYRALRSINPSPYLFYFDYGNFRLFGSSPEAQLQVSKGKASIFPIAGTFRRTGNDQVDAEAASRLAADEKENAEHIMLVDLARNDMSRNAEKVTVEVFREIQYYSHVIHLVSKVTGMIQEKASVIRMAADTFPAGTLSGAPKVMAMNLIDKYEPGNREFYGGAIGYIGLDGTYNHAIMIRTFLSGGNKLTYQAGAGVVARSIPENELQEVNNKLAALRMAIKKASEF